MGIIPWKPWGHGVTKVKNKDRIGRYSTMQGKKNILTYEGLRKYESELEELMVIPYKKDKTYRTLSYVDNLHFKKCKSIKKVVEMPDCIKDESLTFRRAPNLKKMFGCRYCQYRISLRIWSS